MTRAINIIALVMFSALVFWPGLASIDAVDRAEPRYTQTSKQMMEDGTYAVTKLGSNIRSEEPVGLHWLQIAAVKGLGADPKEIWAYRIPSYLAMIALVAITALFGQSLLAGIVPAVSSSSNGTRSSRIQRLADLILPQVRPDILFGTIAALVLIVPWYTQSNARLANPETLFMLAMALVFWSLWEIYKAHTAASDKVLVRFDKRAMKWVLTLWVSVAVALFLKGPVVLMVAGLGILSFSYFSSNWSWLRWSRPLAGTGLALALSAPWIIWVWIATDGAYFWTAWNCQIIGRSIGQQAKHGNPPGFYLLEKPALWLPATFLAIPAIGFAWRNRRTAAILFLISWVAPAWIFYELYATKYPSYMLQFYTAFALLVAAWLSQAEWQDQPVLAG